MVEQICDKPLHKVICFIRGDADDNVACANGDLIAAAPKLLDLLERAREELRLIHMKDCGVIYDVGLRIEMDYVIFALTGA